MKNRIEDWVELRDLFKDLDRNKRQGNNFDRDLGITIMRKNREYEDKYGTHWSIAEIPEGYEEWRIDNL